MTFPPLPRTLALVVLSWPLWLPPCLAQEPSGLPLSGEAAETFLRTADVVGKRALGRGITHSEQYELSDGTRRLKAVWKTVDVFRRGVTRFQDGRFIVDFADSWRHEVAAYELDKLLGLELVPPTVERTFGRTTGSLQMWVEGAMTEADRKRARSEPPDARAWNAQVHKVRLLHQLTFNTDSHNVRNLLVDRSFRLYVIDASRAFAVYGELPSEKELTRFSRSVLEALRTLDRPTLDARVGRWLDGPQIEAVLKRRDKILARAKLLLEGRGEGAVLY